MACREELQRAAGESSLEVIVHETASQGRIQGTDVSNLAARFPTADWYLCGPVPYLENVSRLLKNAHVSADRIHIEAFTPIGIPAATSEERAAFTRYLLVAPQPKPQRPIARNAAPRGKGAQGGRQQSGH